VCVIALAACGGGVASSGSDSIDGDSASDASTSVDGAATPDAHADSGSGFDAAPDGLAEFCSGAQPRMIANGMESTPAVSGKPIILNCCDSAELVVMTQTFQSTIAFVWRVQAGSPGALPATIDLANPPAGWSLQLVVGCDPATASCNPPPDSYTTAFTGTLSVARAANGGYTMSLCLAVSEPAGSPHSILHSLELYAPNVATGP
jgi:hypothetical protein